MSSNRGFIAIAVATAVAAGGIMLMNKFKKTDTGSTKEAASAPQVVQETMETEEEKELENSFFLDPELSFEKNTASIEEWVTAQTETLLAQNEDGKLFVSDRKLIEQDFLRVMQILNCRQVVSTQELKKKLDEARREMLKQHGFDSVEYIKQLVKDTNQVCDAQADFIPAICEKLNISGYVLMESQEAHIGSDEADCINKAYVCKLLDLYLYHPFQNTVTKTKQEALDVVKAVQAKASERIAKSDTLGIFDNPVEYIQCYNALCVDILRADYGFSEADYQFMIDEYDLSANAEMQPFYKRVTEALLVQLSSGGEDEVKEMTEEETKAVEEEAQKRKEAQQEAIRLFMEEKNQKKVEKVVEEPQIYEVKDETDQKDATPTAEKEARSYADMAQNMKDEIERKKQIVLEEQKVTEEPKAIDEATVISTQGEVAVLDKVGAPEVPEVEVVTKSEPSTEEPGLQSQATDVSKVETKLETEEDF